MKKKNKLVNYDKYGYLFVAPFIIAFLVFQLYPIIYTFELSFTDLSGWETKLNFIGFKNYINILNNEFFTKAFINTWIIWIINFIPQISLALLLASWFTNNRLKIKAQGLFKVAFYMPNIITAASVALLFYSLFSYPLGPINQLLINFGILQEPYDFFRSKLATRLIVAFIQFWMWYGNTFIILSAGILGINPNLYEAAMVDGATDRQMFWKITLPLLRPIMIYVLVTSLIGGMQMFDIPYLITNGKGNPDYAVDTMTMFIYKQAFLGSRNYYIAATASVLLLIIILIFSVIIFKSLGEKKEKRVGVR